MKNSIQLFSFISIFSIFLFSNKNQGFDTVKVYRLIDCAKETGTAKIVCLAEAFKASLKSDQVELSQLEYSKSNAAKWSNFPEFRPTRVGIRLGLLNEKQMIAAKALMAAVLSHESQNKGYDELEGALAADEFFGQKTGNTKLFNAGNYFIAFLGLPSTTNLWELQFGGHHFAFANTYQKGKIIGSTPSFRGVEPMEFTSKGRTYQPLEQERSIFSKLIEVLSDAEKNKAKLPTNFNDILLGPRKDGVFPSTKQGLKVSDLSNFKQKIIISAIELYVNDLDTENANAIMKKYLAELPNTYICYVGSGKMNITHDYIRIDGPSVWIEYSAQPSRDFPESTHPHSVWRDHTSDYGGITN